MSDLAIQVERLGKQYAIGGAERRYDTFREALTHSLSSPFHKLRKLGGRAKAEERFWALKDVCFEVKRGEVLGIVGRNGAGKSTLLKVLSKITSPTEGRVTTFGRVASLLEVGTGFHPELTGRENIYLNGAVLGMSRVEVERKFSDIVEFSEVETFLDTPVKRYSSGMYVRLAFAVAAHLEPDVLLVDEVLAVGDAEFQRRCLGKMEEVSSGGRSVLFISHNLPSVLSLCEKAIWLEDGKIREHGSTRSVVSKYLSQTALQSQSVRSENMAGNSVLKILGADVFCDQEHTGPGITAGQDCTIRVQVQADVQIDNLDIEIGIYDELTRPLGLLQSSVSGSTFSCSTGMSEFYCKIHDTPLYPGSYILNVAVTRKNELLDGVRECCRIIVTGNKYFKSGLLPRYGPMLFNSEWQKPGSLN